MKTFLTALILSFLCVFTIMEMRNNAELASEMSRDIR
jgi:hypothetical protein